MSWNRKSTPTGAMPAPGGRQGGTGGTTVAKLLQTREPRVRYFADNDPKAPDPALLDSKAEEVAKKLAGLPASQLRRFYAEVMALKRRAELTNIGDGEIRAQMLLLRAKAAYTKERQERYPDELVAFFNRHAHSVASKHDFLKGFQPHFEAVMAFHKVFENDKGGAA